MLTAYLYLTCDFTPLSTSVKSTICQNSCQTSGGHRPPGVRQIVNRHSTAVPAPPASNRETNPDRQPLAEREPAWPRVRVPVHGTRVTGVQEGHAVRRAAGTGAKLGSDAQGPRWPSPRPSDQSLVSNHFRNRFLGPALPNIGGDDTDDDGGGCP
jgi:hypothetical protein